MLEISQNTMARARLAMREAVRGWIYDPNVMLIDFGWPEKGGKLIEDEPYVRIHVIEKFTLGPELETAIKVGKTHSEIPDKIAGFPVDRPQGDYALHQPFWGWWSRPATPRARRNVPMQGGISISNAYRYSYGTLGGPVKDRETGARMILSNWHVLAGSWWSRPGWPIYQPGWGDGGSRADIVATLTRHAMSSNLDAAVARLTGDRQLINQQFDLGRVSGVGRAQLGMEVVKSGRQTAITRGRVTAVAGTVKINYNGVNRLIRNVVAIEPRLGSQVSDKGDSGSFWLQEPAMYAVGLHFAGSDHPELALALDMQPVLDALNINLVI
jgi:endonuclease G